MNEGNPSEEEMKWDPESGLPPPLTPEYGIDVPSWEGKEAGFPPPLTSEFSISTEPQWPGKEQGLPPPLHLESDILVEKTWPGKEQGFPPPITPEFGIMDTEIYPPDPKEDLLEYKGASLMQGRTLEDPTLLNAREYSKKYLTEERRKLAAEIRAERSLNREKLAELSARMNIETLFSKEIESNPEQMSERYSSLSELRTEEANRLAHRLGGDSEMTEEDVVEERENIASLVDNDEKLRSLKERLAAHYANADELAKEKYSSIQKSVEQALLRNNAFIVHTFLTNEQLRHNANSNIESRATLEDDIDLLLSLEPSISTSSVVPGTRQGLWEDNIGVLLGGGDIVGAEKTDAGSVSLGIKNRKITGHNEVEAGLIDDVISNRREDTHGYNEIVVNNPKVFGIFKSVEVDDFGNMSGDVASFREYLSFAEQKGMPAYVLTPDRRVFEFVAIDGYGNITTGAEISPEQVAKGKAGLSNKNRKEIGENILSKHLFRNVNTQGEAKEILSALDGQETGAARLSSEEYLEQLKLNPEEVLSQLFHFPKDLRSNKKFMLESAQIDASSIYELSGEELKNDLDFVKQIYALIKEQGGRGIYHSMPVALKQNEDIALLAIENSDFEMLDAKFEDSPVIWEKIIDKKVEKMDPGAWFSRDIGQSEITRPSLSMEKEAGLMNLSERLAIDPTFIQKLNQRYPNYKFAVDEYKQIQVTKLA